MTPLNDIKALRASVPAEVQTELYSLLSSNPDAALQRMVELAAEQGEIGAFGVREDAKTGQELIRLDRNRHQSPDL